MWGEHTIYLAMYGGFQNQGSLIQIPNRHHSALFDYLGVRKWMNHPVYWNVTI